MFRSYRIIFQGAQGQGFVVADSAKEASEIAAKALQHNDQIVIEEPDGNVITTEELLAIVRGK